MNKLLKDPNFVGMIDQNTINTKKEIRVSLTHKSLKSHNHIDKFYHLSNKKALFYNMKSYC